MIPLMLSERAEQAARRYDDFAATLETIFKASLMSSNFGDAGQPQKMFAEAYEAASSYFERDKQSMNEDVVEIAEAARQSALTKLESIDSSGLQDAAYEHLSETQTYLSDQLAAQVHRDIAQMRHQLQAAILDVAMIAHARRIPHRKAQVAWMMSNEPSLALAFVDRRGRRTPSRAYVRALYRQALLSVHNEITLMTLADHGLEHASVVKMEEGAEKVVERISITEYTARRSELFHPNSNSFLDVETDDV